MIEWDVFAEAVILAGLVVAIGVLFMVALKVVKFVRDTIRDFRFVRNVVLDIEIQQELLARERQVYEEANRVVDWAMCEWLWRLDEANN